jgi:hypothetical protein
MTIFFCGFCKNDNKTWKSLLSHLQYYHKHEKIQFPCGICPRKFSLRHSLVSHLNSHQSDSEIVTTPQNSILLPLPLPFPLPLPVPTTIRENQIELSLPTTSLMPDHISVPCSSVVRTIPVDTDPREILSESFLKFGTNVLHYPNIPRNFLAKISKSIKNDLILPMQEYVKSNRNNTNDLQTIFDEVNETFDGTTTEEKVCKALKKKKLFIQPTKHFFRKQQGYGHRRGILVVKEISFSFTHVSLKRTLQSLFEIPNVFQQVQDHVRILSSNDGAVQSFLQSQFWKEKIVSTPHKDVLLPYFLYVDGFGPDNTMGPHKKTHAIEAMSAKLPFIPHNVASTLSNIFLVLLYKTIDKKYGLNHFFTAVVEEAIDLEKNGIVVELNGQTRTIQFVFCLILGDNLGLNEILGYICSFVGNYPCRICKVVREILVKQTKEDPSLLRNATNYKTDLQSRSPSTTGIKSQCPLSKIPSFNVWENIAMDIMHDIFEGVAHYNLLEIITNFLQEFFTLEMLNDRIQNFDYGTQIGDIPTVIKKEHLESSSAHAFQMTASEMHCFIILLPMMIGDLIPKDNRIWNFFLIFSKIVAIVTSYSITDDDTKQLDDLVTKHHEEYIELFKKTLKFKYHNMLHYGRILRSHGPLMDQWCMRLEGSHKPKKTYSKVNNCRKNLTYSLAVKDQWQFSKRLLAKEDFSDKITLGKVLNDGRLSHIFFNGTKYEAGQIVHFGYFETENEEKLPEIGRIVKCNVTDGQVKLTVSLNIVSSAFDEHFRCYFTEPVDDRRRKTLQMKDILSYPQNLIRLRNDKSALILKPLPPHF